MMCPYCEGEMEKGYLDQTDIRFPLEWYPAKRDAGFWTSKKRNVKLTSMGTGGNVIAYRCEWCEKIIIDCSNSEGDCV